MKFCAPLLLICLIVLITTSCHKFVPPANGTFRWTENNKEYTAHAAYAYKLHGDSEISVSGCAAENHCLGIDLQSVFTAGTYHIGFNNYSIVNMSYSYGNTGEGFPYGIITISELTQEKISGTFTVKSLNDRVNISGYFDMKFP